MLCGAGQGSAHSRQYVWPVASALAQTKLARGAWGRGGGGVSNTQKAPKADVTLGGFLLKRQFRLCVVFFAVQPHPSPRRESRKNDKPFGQAEANLRNLF